MYFIVGTEVEKGKCEQFSKVVSFISFPVPFLPLETFQFIIIFGELLALGGFYW